MIVMDNVDDVDDSYDESYSDSDDDSRDDDEPSTMTDISNQHSEE